MWLLPSIGKPRMFLSHHGGFRARLAFFFLVTSIKIRKMAKTRNRYNQAPHLIQDTNGKVTTAQLDITKKSQEVSPFPAGDHKASTNRRAWKHKKQDINNINDPQKKHRLGTVSIHILLEGWSWFNGAPTSPLVQMWIKTHRCLVCRKDP